MTWRGSTTVLDRIFACLPYLLPLIDALMFGRFLLMQFPVLQLLFVPLLPLIQLYTSVPFISLIVFFALFLAVVRNPNINHFIRFNAMQAILLDIVLILCNLVFQYILGPALQVGILLETLSNTIFLAIVVAFVYAVVQSLMGRYAEIPTISDAAYAQVR
ncbi:hypothetical protein H6G20_15090 [Desertifilum sp. FACHB-1129]|uniref:Tic20 family protein n=2 Tax=Cyanophyceae TaxID=3028117 RepID=A0A1E5QGW7_9CYAN|nr:MULTISPECIES: Tic20 family protein [Cyanophyceae]MDA0209586.1 hypothetical protein [Cyanobacteria bacterium FC1]MDI9640678.1 hypothetical protein [Geitlerinema splendidum]MBD2312996.1 hypothetical protein [Desertifilum sp. FACHB-1129]MBD2320958.1 hypothetical protein [Desertifilum sp. FACHB-866]MBD2331087.1 hypothetical protein [Desertifilum sp. FACHB-868]